VVKWFYSIGLHLAAEQRHLHRLLSAQAIDASVVTYDPSSGLECHSICSLKCPQSPPYLSHRRSGGYSCEQGGCCSSDVRPPTIHAGTVPQSQPLWIGFSGSLQYRHRGCSGRFVVAKLTR